MIMQTAEMIGIDRLGIGSDLCENWDYSVLEWMRSGRWTMGIDHGEGTAASPSWPRQPSWFAGSKDMRTVAQGLDDVGFSETDVAKIMGQNWQSFFEKSFVGKART